MTETDAGTSTDQPLDSRVVAGASVETVREELRKLAENMRYRAECQITASGFWGNFQLLVGGAAAVTAAVAGASAFSKQSVVAGAFAVAASVLSATLATVKAGERAGAHERSANELNLLSESAFRVVELSGNAAFADDLAGALLRTTAERDAIVRKAPFVNRRLSRLAATFLVRGQSYFGGAAKGAMPPVRPRLLRRLWNAWRSPTGSAPQPER